MAIKKAERVLRNLLDTAGITINGSNPYDIQVNNPKFYRRVLAESALGFGESYMDGWWDCEAIDQLIDRILRADLEYAIKGDLKIVLFLLKTKLFNLQNKKHAFEVGQKHYDISNKLYSAMLDKRMNYTCGYWKNADNLDDAQEAKLDLVCKKIGLKPGMKVLELGCGFGSFAGYAAEKYGVSVTGVTVSKRQAEYGNERYKNLPVELKLMDYRDVEGEYDRVISIGIMEHIGYRNYETYMKVVDKTLKKGGLAFIHTIGRNDSSTTANAWITKYIFPNGVLPSIEQLAKAMDQYFVIEDLHNFGPDYDKTLLAWYENFENAWDNLKSDFDERFRRMWHYYLLSAAGGFRARQTQLWHFVMTRIGDPKPDCRIS
ncbi:MAG: cyclopropane fatty acyl phospholipid synthase [Chlorobi bacterium]|nr:cyclopropane fatty acyl phospholipid synthase [Chlorobiota bacterium]